MSYFPCQKCGGMKGMIGNTWHSCACEAPTESKAEGGVTENELCAMLPTYCKVCGHDSCDCVEPPQPSVQPSAIEQASVTVGSCRQKEEPHPWCEHCVDWKVTILRNRLASKDEAVMWKLLLKRESELSSLRAEVERLRTTVEQREKLLDRFTANNIKLNQELEKLRTTVTALRGDHNHETCAHDLTYWYQFHGDCCTGCGGNLHLIHPLVNLYPHFTGACRAALSEARKEG